MADTINPADRMPSVPQTETFDHAAAACTGVLVTNLGTPDSPTPGALRRYLAEFLSDRRVVDRPRWLWLPVLYGIILNLRPRRSAHAYQQIWTDEGSPLLAITRRQTQALQAALQSRFSGPVRLACAMRYGNPSIADGLEQLRRAGARRLLVLPLYPQYSAATTASTFDAIAAVFKGWPWLPELRMVTSYHDDPGYIDALKAAVERHWRDNGRGERLLLSFHGVPRRYLLQGDPYHCQCHKTARLLAEALALKPDQWQVTFQSRFGPERWLEPYTDATLESLARQGVTDVDLICPGFSADCLETLEENDMRNRDRFLSAGGRRLGYVPCLNDDAAHIAALADLVARHTRGWPETESGWDAAAAAREQAATAQRAAALSQAQSASS
jgi:ferrochelatase